MSAEKFYCFTKEGEDIYLFTLHNALGTKVSISNYGAIITSFIVSQKNGLENDIVLGFDNIRDYLSPEYIKNYAYIGTVCGRYANRIKDASFVLDNKKYQLTKNMGNEQLHGGKEGFDKKIWQLVSFSDSSLELKYMSKDGEEGFPGNLETHIRFELNNLNELNFEFTAFTDSITAINLTHHSYFNLNNGLGTIEEHQLKIYASNYLEQDANHVCNGNLIPVKNTAFDFTEFKSINRNWDKSKGYDQCFVLDKKNNELSLVAELRSEHSGIHLQLFSTEPAVQLYSAQGFPNLKGKNGVIYGPCSGLCLETHVHPNAINIPHFPSTILKPGETYTQKNIYRISTEEVK